MKLIIKLGQYKFNFARQCTFLSTVMIVSYRNGWIYFSRTVGSFGCRVGIRSYQSKLLNSLCCCSSERNPPGAIFKLDAKDAVLRSISTM